LPSALTRLTLLTQFSGIVLPDHPAPGAPFTRNLISIRTLRRNGVVGR
jgi:hypothetical protein